MRLKPDEVQAIRDCARASFGADAIVRLFGSRVRDDLRGGDIDLHIIAEDSARTSWRAEATFRRALEDRIGEQKVDIILRAPAEARRPIDELALMDGIVL